MEPRLGSGHRSEACFRAASRRAIQIASLLEVKRNSRARMAGRPSRSDDSPEPTTIGCAHRVDILEEVDRAVVEPEVVDGVDDLAFLDQPDAVASQSGDEAFARVDGADVPEAGDQQGPFGLSDQVFECARAPLHDQAARIRQRLAPVFLAQ